MFLTSSLGCYCAAHELDTKKGWSCIISYNAFSFFACKNYFWLFVMSLMIFSVLSGIQYFHWLDNSHQLFKYLCHTNKSSWWENVFFSLSVCRRFWSQFPSASITTRVSQVIWGFSGSKHVAVLLFGRCACRQCFLLLCISSKNFRVQREVKRLGTTVLISQNVYKEFKARWDGEYRKLLSILNFLIFARLFMNLRLLFIMQITESLEFLTAAFGPTLFFKSINTFNKLQGVWVFLLFVYNKRVFKLISGWVATVRLGILGILNCKVTKVSQMHQRLNSCRHFKTVQPLQTSLQPFQLLVLCQ